MRGWLALVFACGCYHPNPAIDVPCSSTQTCPDNQVCDTNQSPPVCVAAIADARPLSDGPGNGTDSGSPPSDATPDAFHPPDAAPLPDAAPPDAAPPDAAPPPDAPPPVAITFVQVRTVKPTAATTTLAFTSAVTAHDAIIVCLNFPSGGPTLTSLTDSLGNGYSVIVGPIDSGGDLHYVAVALNVAGGADTVTVTLSGAPSGGSDLFLLEYSGIAHTSAFDVSAHQSGTTTAMTSGTATTTLAHELVLGYAEAGNATSGTGFTGRATLSGNLVEDMVVTATGSYAATANTTGSGTWTMIMATFKGE